MIVLASQSPRRAELLRAAGIEFQVEIANIEELRAPSEAPENYVLRLAREKAEAVLRPRLARGEEPLVLGADTVVVLAGDVLEKPVDAAGARRMLTALANRSHQVMTGVALASREGTEARLSVTEVRFLPIPESEIEAYVAGGEPMDKAGAYAIQGGASRWVEEINGCYFNVVGLPVSLVCRMLRERGRL
jgi:septum formation protein